MKIAMLVYILMPLSIILAFLWVPPAQFLGEASRILYFHVPVAMVSVIAFFVSGIYSIIYLYDKEKKYKLLEEKSFNSARIGILFTILTIITGSIWAKISWGTYWNWDPRESSIIILLLIYLAYFSLRSALSNNSNKNMLTSTYLIFAMIVVPFFVFIIPRVYPSLHPDPIINANREINLEEKMRLTLLISVISFTMLFFYIFNLTNKLSIITDKIEEKNYEE